MILPFYKGQSMIELTMERFTSELNNNIPFIIATTDNPIDDEIESIAKRKKIKCFRGSENDVLDRFIRAADKFNLDKVIRVCADNPLIDIKGTGALTSFYESGEWDYLGYKVKGDKPTILTHSGFWGEVVTLSALKRVFKVTTEPVYREHVTNYIYQHPEKFKVKLICTPEYMFHRDDVRFTVDTKEDFEMMKEIYDRLVEENVPFAPEYIVNWLDRHPVYIGMMKKQIEQNKKV
jgi:spore coat polysaccharide biosynthesis protein SpsF